MALTTIKKYSNRRLYDTDDSRYITLDELAERVRRGGDVRVVDAKTNEDLTQATLLQIVLETNAARLLPVPLLSRLIRMENDALGDFFTRYVSFALEMYLTAKSGAQAMSPYVPFSTAPFSATNALARMMSGLPFWGDGGSPFGQGHFPRGAGHADHGAEPPPSPPPPPPSAHGSGVAETAEFAALRSELDELRREMRASKPKRRA